MQTLDAISTRSSIGLLTEPAPGPDIIRQALAAALRAPDHRTLRPWRFLTIQGNGLGALGDLFLQAGRAKNPDLSEAEADKLNKMPQRAPLIIVAVTRLQADAKVPEWEQILSTGAAVQNLLLALHDQGFAAMWRTGDLASSAVVKSGLGLLDTDLIAGFIYVGTAGTEKKITPLNVADFVSVWPPV